MVLLFEFVTMTASSVHPSLLEGDTSTKRVKELQQAIQQTTLKLNEVQQRRQNVEEEIINCRQETERRVELVTGQGEVVDALQQLGCLLQEEMQLSEQLNSGATQDRNEMAVLLERSKCAEKKANDLAANILEVKRRLRDLKASSLAAPVSSSKHKRNQRKQ